MNGLAVPLKLTLAQMRAHPLRLLLTCVAMIAAASAVVWVVSGYDALVAQFDDMADDYLGRYNLVIVPQSSREAALGPELVEALEADPGVAEVAPIYQVSVATRVLKETPAPKEEPAPQRVGRGGRGRGRMMSPSLLGISTGDSPYPMVEGNWLDPHGDAEMVVSKSTARDLKISLGDEVEVTHALDGRGQRVAGATPRVLKVVGIIEQPQTQAALAPRGDAARGAARGPASSALYVLPDTAERVTSAQVVPHMACVKLKDTTPLSEFRARWEKRLAEADPAAVLVTQQEVESGLEQSFSTQSVRGQAYSATGMALLASLLVIYTALSMGVAERSRQFAMLRAIALTRGQLATIILLESLLLAVLGWVGGLLAGWVLLQWAGAPQGGPAPTLGWQCVWLSGVCAVGGAMLAAIAPMWRAVRGDALGAMQRRGPMATLAGPLAVVGLGLVAVPLILAFAVQMDDETTYAITTTAGVMSLGVGILLISPMAVIVAEKLLGPVLARLMGLDPRLLAGQLSSNLWRTIGAAAALTMGLGLYVATQTWGHSMLQPFVPDQWMPDALVQFPRGVSDAEVQEVVASVAALGGECLPIALEQPKLTDDNTNSEVRWNATRAESVVLCGVDIDKALSGNEPMLDLEFTDGTRDEAFAKLEAGGACLIPDFLQTESGLKIGDTLRLTPPTNPSEVVEYTIVGAVRQPGVHWLTKMSGMRRRGGLMAGVVFAKYDDVRKDFGATTNDFYWVDLADGKTTADLQSSLEPVAERNNNPPQRVDDMMRRFSSDAPTKQSFRTKVTTSADVSGFVNGRADEVIWSMSQFPLMTLVIGVIGVVNAVMASVLSRRWEHGVLRALGVSRGSLFRLILAEAILIGLVACLLSLVFGVIAGYSGTGLARYVYRHGGFLVPLVLPWSQIALGFAMAVGLCIAASLMPAMMTAFSEPLRLLQRGRSSS